MTQMHDFGDGPVPAHQHSNGGGWVADTATVEENVYVSPNSKVCGEAKVLGQVSLHESVFVQDSAIIKGNVKIFNAHVCDKASISGNCVIYGPNVTISKKSKVYGNVILSSGVIITDNARVFGFCNLDNVEVCDSAMVCKDACLRNISVTHNTIIDGKVFFIQRSDAHKFMYLRCQDGKHRIVAGCRYFTLPEAKQHWNKDHTRHAESMWIIRSLLDHYKKFGY